MRDLLNPATLKIKGGLKVRQHPKLGFYGMLSFFETMLHLYCNIQCVLNYDTTLKPISFGLLLVEGRLCLLAD